jgi:glucose-6-phosphate isomerase
VLNSLRLEFYPKIDDNKLQEAIDLIHNNKNKWNTPFFFDTKSNLDLNQIKDISVRLKLDNLKNVIVLGTGGSIQTLLALKHLSQKEFFPITSSRAVELKGCLDKTSPEDSIVIPISRGGETLDINSTIGIFQKKGYKFLGLSSMGTMHKILQKMDSPILDVPNLSGRFAGSVTNVGIAPAFILGINVNKFLKGLEEGYKNFANFEKNMALEFAAYLFQLYQKNFKNIFSMPYSKNIEGAIGLWVQGISESTGKDGKGMIGTYQGAPICQHSVLEYLLGGTKGVVIPILWVLNHETPDLILESSIEYVNGRSAQSIVNYQADATFQALIQQGIPSAKVSLDNSKEFNMGVLISFILSSVYYFCLLLDVNWADNPKVIIGKQICNQYLKDNIGPEEMERMRKNTASNTFRNFF